MAEILQINKCDTTELFVTDKALDELAKSDKLKNMASVGDIGFTMDVIEGKANDVGKIKKPGSVNAENIEVEQHLLAAEFDKMFGWMTNSTALALHVKENKDDDTTIGLDYPLVYIADLKITGNSIDDEMHVTYSFIPGQVPTINNTRFTTTATEP